ncbi:tRNA pseudouridine synthase A [Arthrobacter sp. Br18]|uniref:tRNA pseudouridine synthase A n=1 Tax=Arthrobacter sp. Br18 TaxID=1312954 RepID=UPI0006845E4F|nr:tRNA pseudouridine synthase A [Arthrobacter sp. Br18]
MTTHEPALPSGTGGLLRVRIDLAYDGGPFAGWALQPGLATVQGVVEEALFTLLRRPARVTVAGRTDTGVHARGQVMHVDLTAGEWQAMTRGKELSPEEAMRRRLTGTVNLVLSRQPPGIGRTTRNAVPAVVVRGVRRAPTGFDARFSALWRRYSYRIADVQAGQDPLARHSTLWYPGELDVGLLNDGAAHLRGMQDFRAFCKPRAGATTIRELQRYEFQREPDGAITATIQADAFCHNMVRALIGSTLMVGSGEVPAGWLKERLEAGLKDAQSILAPAHALVLEEVAYPGADELGRRAALTRARRGPSALDAPAPVP